MSTLSTLNEVATCAYCQAIDLNVLFEATDYISKDIFKVVQCRQCRLVMTSPVPAENAMSRYYPDSYFGAGGQRFTGLGEQIIRLERQRRARAILRICPQAGRALDVGCGRGVMLKKLKSKGWECYGTELSETLAHQLKADNIQIYHELNVKNCHFPPAFFDVVSLWHSFEHFSTPISTLEEIYRILKPNGVVVLATPNFGGWMAQWSQQNWFGLDVPRHLFHYTRQTLPVLLKAQGFYVERISDLSFEQDFFVTAQSLLNILGFRQNAFYDIIRNKSAQSSEGVDMSFGERTMLTVVGGVLLLLSFPFSLVASLARSGGTIEVWGRK